MRQILALCGLCLLGLAPALAADQVTVLDTRYQATASLYATAAAIDWSQSAIFVSVQAVAPAYLPATRLRQTAKDQAMANAQREIVQAIGSLRLTGYATVADAVNAKVLPDDLLSTVAKSVIPLVERWNGTQRTLTLTCALPLTGKGSPGEIAARMLAIEQRMLPKSGIPAQHATEQMTLKEVTPATQLSAGPYTGVILDCSGLKYARTLLPKLVTAGGIELWGTLGVNTQGVMEEGLVGFAASLRDALAMKRIGSAPLLLRPIGTAGPLGGNLVLSPEDAQLLTEHHTTVSLLDNLAVVVVCE